MTIEELHHTPMLREARHISDIILAEQVGIEAIALAAEQDARKRLQEQLGMSAAAAHVEPTGLIDAHIVIKKPVISPQLLDEALPRSKRSEQTTSLARNAIGDILLGTDDRLLVITGPCSIHDGDAALEYARKVATWRKQYGDKLEIIMRAYPEKPRSGLDWKGLVYDPKLDGSYDINLGLTLTRMIASRITDMGVPIAVERLNALTPQYLNGLVAYDAIGARNVTDQKAREYASGTSSPVGVKNAMDGSIEPALAAIVAANGEHTFLGTSMSGMSAQIETSGNPLAHLILRGSNDGPNYSAEHIARATSLLEAKELLQAIIIDASHGNSGKLARNQLHVIRDLSTQISAGQRVIKGVMLESNLVGGAQKLEPGCDLEYGKSITDECIDLGQTEALLVLLANAVRARRNIQTT